MVVDRLPFKVLASRGKSGPSLTALLPMPFSYGVLQRYMGFKKLIKEFCRDYIVGHCVEMIPKNGKRTKT